MNIPDQTATIPHHSALLAFQLAVASQEASGNAHTPLTEGLREGLATLTEQKLALITVKTPAKAA